ncbi:MAG: helix-turn-helix transcriptional regulator [Cytophagales bacterium]|nr:helix-turn-helix transcriptional regulator [Cytophagales bacterium]
MRKTVLGELEELVLLVVAASREDAYGVTVCEQLQAETERSFSISAVHTTLYRLEEKGFLSSQVGGATQERGGRRKRLFALTAAGGRVLLDIQQTRLRLWQAIPHSKLQRLGLA